MWIDPENPAQADKANEVETTLIADEHKFIDVPSSFLFVTKPRWRSTEWRGGELGDAEYERLKAGVPEVMALAATATPKPRL